MTNETKERIREFGYICWGAASLCSLVMYVLFSLDIAYSNVPPPEIISCKRLDASEVAVYVCEIKK